MLSCWPANRFDRWRYYLHLESQLSIFPSKVVFIHWRFYIFRNVYCFYVRFLPLFSLLITEQFNNSLEAFARICVNGFGSSSLPLQSEPYSATLGALLLAGVTGTGLSEMARQTSLNRGRSITLQRSMLGASDSGSAYSSTSLYEATLVDGGFTTLDSSHLNANFIINGITFTNFNGQTQSPNHNQTHHRDTSLHARQSSEPSYIICRELWDLMPMASHPKADTLSLPFRLSISHLHSKTKRNVPYLRRSWTRIGYYLFCFKITFGLATTAFDHGSGGLQECLGLSASFGFLDCWV